MIDDGSIALTFVACKPRGIPTHSSGLRKNRVLLLVYRLVGKSKDTDGRPATYLPQFNGLSFSFVRWKQEGGAVNAQGKVVPAHEVQQLSEDEAFEK